MHISEARISNFRIIDQLTASFGPGLNVITGETGAGKTILVGAIGFALGERASRDSLRQGADEAVVEVVLEIGPPDDSSSVESQLREELLRLLEGLVAPEDEIVVLKRSMRRDGRGKSFVNYRPVPLSVLQRIGELFVDFHGQHEHQRLFSTQYQLLTLDEFGGLSDARNEVTGLYERFKELDAQVKAIESGNRRAGDERELLEFYVQELEQLRIALDEAFSGDDRQRAIAALEAVGAHVLLWLAGMADARLVIKAQAALGGVLFERRPGSPPRLQLTAGTEAGPTVVRLLGGPVDQRQAARWLRSACRFAPAVITVNGR